MRSRFTSPGRNGRYGFTCPLTVTSCPSFPCMYSISDVYGAGAPPASVMSFSTSEVRLEPSERGDRVVGDVERADEPAPELLGDGPVDVR